MATKSMPMDEAAMRRCMKSKSHEECMRQMRGKGKKAGGGKKRPPPFKKGGY